MLCFIVNLDLSKVLDIVYHPLHETSFLGASPCPASQNLSFRIIVNPSYMASISCYVPCLSLYHCPLGIMIKTKNNNECFRVSSYSAVHIQ